MAANDDFQDENPSVPPTEPETDKTVNSTKAYSERLNKDRERIRSEERDGIAKSFGYENWAEYLDAQTNNSLLEKGLDPEQIKPLIKDAIKNDPDYMEAMRIKQEKEKLEATIWANDELKRLNEKFGLSFKKVEDLGKETIDLWNSGMSLDKAYAANHYEDIRNSAIRRAKEINDGKSHLTDTNAGNQVAVKTISSEQMRVFKALNPRASEEQIKAYLNRK